MKLAAYVTIHENSHTHTCRYYLLWGILLFFITVKTIKLTKSV